MSRVVRVSFLQISSKNVILSTILVLFVVFSHSPSNFTALHHEEGSKAHGVSSQKKREGGSNFGILGVSAICDARIPPTFLTASQGEFEINMSPFGTYFNNLFCHWVIRCKSGQNIGLNISLVTHSIRDNLTVFTDVTDGVVLDTIGGPRRHSTWLYKRNAIYLLFRSDSEGVASGFQQSSYQCFSSKCSTGTDATTVLSTEKSEEISFGTKYSGEECRWTIECLSPGSKGVITYLYFSAIPKVGGLSITNMQGIEEELEVLTRAKDTKYQVYFNSSGDIVDLSFECVSLLSSEVNPCDGNPLVLTMNSIGGGDSKKLSIPMTLRGRYFNNLNCSWLLQCPEGGVMHMTGGGSVPPALGEGLSIYDIRGHQHLGTWQAKRHHKGISPFSFNAIFQRNALHVVLTSVNLNMRKEPSWLDVSFQCTSSNCSTNSTEVDIGEDSVDLPFELDTRSTGNRCVWHIRCENQSSQIVFFGTSGDWRGLYLFNETKAALDGLPSDVDLSQPEFAENHSYLLPFQTEKIFAQPNMSVYYNSSSFSGSVMFNFICATPIGDLCAKGTMTNYSGARGVVNVPTSKTGKYFSGLRCVNKLECSSADENVDWKSMEITGSAFTVDMNDNMTFFDSDWNEITAVGGHAPSKSGPVPKPFYFFLRKPLIYAVWTTDLVGVFPFGFVVPVSFRCFVSLCSNNRTSIPLVTNHGNISGAIASLSAKNPGERCEWDIQCTNTSQTIYINSQVGENIGDTISFFNEKGEKVVLPESKMLTHENTYHILFDSVVNWQSGNREKHSYHLKFECLNREEHVFCKPGQEIVRQGANLDEKLPLPTYLGIYFHEMECVYRVTCPDGMNVALIGGFMGPEDEHDKLLVFNANESKLLYEFYGSVTEGKFQVPVPIKHLTRESELVLRFSSNDRSVGKGFSPFLKYQCYVGTCSSNMTTSVTMSHVMGTSSLQIQSLLFNEECEWILTCQNPLGWVTYENLVNDDGNSVNSNPDTVVQGVTVFSGSTQVASPFSSSMQSGIPLVVKYLAPSQSHYFSFNFACFFATEFLGSPCALNAMKWMAAPNDTLELLRSPFEKYYNNLFCTWFIGCAPGQNIALRGSLTAWGEPDFLLLLNSSKGLLKKFEGRIGEKDRKKIALPVDFALILRTDSLFVQFESDANGTSAGFSNPVEYKCLQETCSTNVTGRTPVIFERNRSTKVTFGNTYDYESCSWELRCEEERYWMVFQELQGVTKDIVVYQDDDADPVPTGSLPIGTIIPMAFLIVQYTAPIWDLSENSHHLKISFQCFEPFQSSGCGIGQALNLTYPQFYFSLPKVPSGKYGNRLVCTWRVLCDDAKSVQLSGALLTHSSNDNLTIYYANWSVFRVHGTSNGTSPPDRWRYLLRSVPVIVRFQTDNSGKERGDVDRDIGYRCLQDYCTTDTKEEKLWQNETDANTDLFLQVNSALEGEQCDFTFGCGNAGQCLFVTNFSMSSRYLLKFRSIAGHEVQWQNYQPILLPVSKLIASWQSGGAGDFFSLSFHCRDMPFEGYCSDEGNLYINKLWLSVTPGLTDTRSVSPTEGTASQNITRSESLTPVEPPTATSTSSKSKTKSFSMDEAMTQTSTDSKTLFPTKSHSVLPSSTLSSTETEILTETATSSETISHSESPSFSMGRIHFEADPTILYMSVLNGKDIGSTRVAIKVLGSKFAEHLPIDFLKKEMTTKTRLEVDKFYDGSYQSNGFFHRWNFLWNENSLVHLNQTHILIEFQLDAKFYLLGDEHVRITFPKKLFWRGEAMQMTSIELTITDDVPTRKLNAIETTGVSASAAMGAMGVPAAATQAARVSFILALQSCSFPMDEPLSFFQSPTGVAIGDSKYRYYLGAMLLNPVIWFGLLAFHFLVVMFVNLWLGQTASEEKKTLQDAMMQVYFPSFTIVIVMLFLQDSLGALFNVFWNEPSMTWKVIAAMMFLVFPYGPLFIFYYRFYLVNQKMFRAWTKAVDRDEHGWIWRFLHGDREWEDSLINPDLSRGFTRMYGQFFMPYRDTRTWFAIVDLLCVIALAVISVVQPQDGDCLLLTWITFGVLLVFAIATILLSPYIAGWEQLFFCLLTSAQALAVGAIGLSIMYDTRYNKKWITWSMRLMDGTMYLVMVKLVLDIGFAIEMIWDEHQQKLEKEKEDKFQEECQQERRDGREILAPLLLNNKRRKGKKGGGERAHLGNDLLYGPPSMRDGDSETTVLQVPTPNMSSFDSQEGQHSSQAPWDTTGHRNNPFLLSDKEEKRRQLEEELKRVREEKIQRMKDRRRMMQQDHGENEDAHLLGMGQEDADEWLDEQLEMARTVTAREERRRRSKRGVVAAQTSFSVQKNAPPDDELAEIQQSVKTLEELQKREKEAAEEKRRIALKQRVAEKKLLEEKNENRARKSINGSSMLNPIYEMEELSLRPVTKVTPHFIQEEDDDDEEEEEEEDIFLKTGKTISKTDNAAMNKGHRRNLLTRGLQVFKEEAEEKQTDFLTTNVQHPEMLKFSLQPFVDYKRSEERERLNYLKEMRKREKELEGHSPSLRTLKTDEKNNQHVKGASNAEAYELL